MATGDEMVPGVVERVNATEDPLFPFTLDELWSAIAKRTDGAIFYARLTTKDSSDTYVIRGQGGLTDQIGLMELASYHLQRQLESMVNTLHESD